MLLGNAPQVSNFITFHCFFWPFPLLPQVPRIDSVQNHLMEARHRHEARRCQSRLTDLWFIFDLLGIAKIAKDHFGTLGRQKKHTQKPTGQRPKSGARPPGNVLFTGLLFTFSKKPEASRIPHTELKQSSRNSHMTEPVVKLPKTLVAFNLTLSRL